MDTSSRNRRLAQYGFQCGCEACRSGLSDIRRQQAGKDLTELEDKLPAAFSKTVRKKLLAEAESLALYVEHEGFADYFTKTSRLTAEYAALVGDKARGRKWAQKLLEYHRMVDENSSESLDAAAMLASF
jgi:hypothetical protein